MKPRIRPKSKLHVKISQGCYVLDVKDPQAWLAIKFGMLMRGIPWFEKPYHAKSMAKTHPVISEADLLFIVANPGGPMKMQEIHGLLGITA